MYSNWQMSVCIRKRKRKLENELVINANGKIHWHSFYSFFFSTGLVLAVGFFVEVVFTSGWFAAGFFTGVFFSVGFLAVCWVGAATFFGAGVCLSNLNYFI